MEKKIACEVAIRYMKDGMNIGFGTGSTVNVLLDTIDEMNLTFKKSTFVSTSDRSIERTKTSKFIFPPFNHIINPVVLL